jgi:hypothetical protein
LDPALLDLQIQRDGNGIPLPIKQQPIQNLKIEGFIPIIINITPVQSLPMYLGLKADSIPSPRARGDVSEQPMDHKNRVKASVPEKLSLLN